ncbi:MAG TPA: hypothetical protein VE687_00625, partial [Stellaceae bacterium]|nr:hypothetical protein [Stellaceae bacterium]
QGGGTTIVTGGGSGLAPVTTKFGFHWRDGEGKFECLVFDELINEGCGRGLTPFTASSPSLPPAGKGRRRGSDISVLGSVSVAAP